MRLICCVQLCCDLFSLISTVKAQTEKVKAYFFLWLYLYLYIERKTQISPIKLEFLALSLASIFGCLMSSPVDSHFLFFRKQQLCGYIALSVTNLLCGFSMSQWHIHFFSSILCLCLWFCVSLSQHQWVIIHLSQMTAAQQPVAWT